MSVERITIGTHDTWGAPQALFLHRENRDQHAYVVGKTGTGKSTLLRNMILQDIESGAGVGLLDPHGDLSEEILNHIPPTRIRDVVYVNPADRNHPVGFNLLRAVSKEHRHLVASGIVSAFKNVWRESWGPRLEYILYATISSLSCVENASLMGVQRILVDERYRQWVVSQVDDPIVRSFWEDEFASYEKRFLSEVIAPLQNKIGQLVMSPILRNILGQVRNRLDIRSAMDTGKILIANLSKGHLGEDKSNLLGSMLVTAFQLAAMGRSDVPSSERRPFTLYVDEFQNYSTESFASILSEARKYKLSLVLANQFTSQLNPTVRDAVFGNVGTLMSFRVSESDAHLLAREFGGSLDPSAFTDLGNFEARVRMLVNNHQSEPMLIKTLPPIGERYGRAESIVNWSREAYATPRTVVEGRILRWRGNRF